MCYGWVLRQRIYVLCQRNGRSLYGHRLALVSFKWEKWQYPRQTPANNFKSQVKWSAKDEAGYLEKLTVEDQFQNTTEIIYNNQDSPKHFALKMRKKKCQKLVLVWNKWWGIEPSKKLKGSQVDIGHIWRRICSLFPWKKWIFCWDDTKI